MSNNDFTWALDVSQSNVALRVYVPIGNVPSRYRSCQMDIRITDDLDIESVFRHNGEIVAMPDQLKKKASLMLSQCKTVINDKYGGVCASDHVSRQMIKSLISAVERYQVRWYVHEGHYTIKYLFDDLKLVLSMCTNITLNVFGYYCGDHEFVVPVCAMLKDDEFAALIEALRNKSKVNQ